MSLIVAGRIVPLTKDRKVAQSENASFQGRVWIGDDGRIAAVSRGTAGAVTITNSARSAEFDNAPLVDVGNDLVVPGFIDLHSHLAYATLPLWTEPNRTVPFQHPETGSLSTLPASRRVRWQYRYGRPPIRFRKT